MRYQVYWTPETELVELQGASIDFKSYNEVVFQHQFLPSGKPIAVWHSKANYLDNKRVADLPHLKPGDRYRFDRYVTNSERMYAYLGITFLDEYGQMIETQQRNADKVEVTVPLNTVSYRVGLLSAGSGEFTFRGFAITHLGDEGGYLLAGDQALTEHLFAYLDYPKTTRSKTLRVIFTEPQLRSTDFVKDMILPSHQAVLYLATDLLNSPSYLSHDLTEIIMASKKQVRAHQVEFVGYGLISSYVALAYQRKIKGSKAVVSDPKIDKEVPYLKRLPASLQEFLVDIPLKVSQDMTNDTVLLTSPFTNRYQVPIKVPHPNEDRLGTLYYDTKTLRPAIIDQAPYTMEKRESKKRSARSKGMRLKNFFTK